MADRSSHQTALDEVYSNYTKAIDYYVLKKKNFLSLAYKNQVAQNARAELLKESFEKEQQWAEQFLKLVHKMYKAISFHYEAAMGPMIRKQGSKVNRNRLINRIKIDAYSSNDAVVEKQIKEKLEEYYKKIETDSDSLDFYVDLTFEVYKKILVKEEQQLRKKRRGPVLSSAYLGNGLEGTLGYVEEVLMGEVLKKIERNIVFATEKKIADLLTDMKRTGSFTISGETLMKEEGKDISSDLAYGYDTNNIFLADITGGYTLLGDSENHIKEFGRVFAGENANQIFNMIQAGGTKNNKALNTTKMFGFSLKKSALEKNFQYTSSKSLMDFINSDKIFRSYSKTSKAGRKMNANKPEDDEGNDKTWNGTFAHFEMLRQVSRMIIPLMGPHNVAVLEKNGLMWTDDFLRIYGLRMRIATDLYKEDIEDGEVFPRISSSAVILYEHNELMKGIKLVFSRRTDDVYDDNLGEYIKVAKPHTSVILKFGAKT